jgi:hypothetical protein
MLALPTVAEKSPGQRTAPSVYEVRFSSSNPRGRDLRSQDTREPQECSSQARPATSGGRLVPVLEGAGVRLRCLARRPAALASRVSQTTEVVAGDLLDPGSLDRALAGIAVAYYLVHSMAGHGDYLETDLLVCASSGAHRDLRRDAARDRPARPGRPRLIAAARLAGWARVGDRRRSDRERRSRTNRRGCNYRPQVLTGDDTDRWSGHCSCQRSHAALVLKRR